MALSFDDSIKEVLGNLVYQLAQAQTQLAQLAEKVQELETQLVAAKAAKE